VPREISGLLLAALLAIGGCASLEGARLYRSGTAALDAGEPERAVRELERAARLVPRASEIQNHLGLAYAELGRSEEASLAFERAVALDCENGAAQRNRAHTKQVRDAERAAGEESAGGR